MKKYTTIKIGSLILLSSILTCCTNILEQEPLGLATPDNFWNSQANVESAVAGDYALLKNTLLRDSNFLLWGEFTGKTFMNSQFWIADYIEGSGNYILPYRDPSRNWTGFFRAANWGLAIEKHVSEMPNSIFKSINDKNRLIGEAAFIRSLSYFYMARIWGDVPVVEDVYESQDQLIKDGFIIGKTRENEKKVLAYALEAVNKAIELLQYSAPGSPDWAIRANKASAEALKTHITLWYASRDNFKTELLDQAIASATSVINNSNASLIDYTENLELDTNNGIYSNIDFDKMCIGQSKTGLFEINISTDTNESFRFSSADNTHTGLTLDYPKFKEYSNIASFIDPEYYGTDAIVSDPDRENDARRKIFFSNPNFDDYDSFLLKYSQTSKDPASTDPYATFSESNILIFRLADIYLLRAEAYMRKGDLTSALEDLNTIRNKAGVPDYSGPTDINSLTKAIFDERALEFVGEGQSGFDRIRMNYFEGVNWMTLTRITKKGYFWPVHPDIISINPLIIQTEYWKGAL